MSQSMWSWHESAQSQIASVASKYTDSEFNDSSTELVKMEKATEWGYMFASCEKKHRLDGLWSAVL